MTITFLVEIDWAHNGTWTDETSRTRRVQIKSGFEGVGRAVATVGRCLLTMDNGDQRFSPGYSGSPLYGDLLPRRQVRVSASDGVTTWVLFRGFVDEIAPIAGEWGGGECLIACVDAIAMLDQQRIGVAHEDSKAVDEAVSAVVSSAYTPPATSYADNGDTLTHYGRSWQPELTSCLDALREIAEAVYGRFYIARDGTATYQSRDERQDSSAVAAAVLGDAEYWERVVALQPDHLVAYWRLNESEGTDAADSSENGYDGTASGVLWGRDGIGDGSTAALFDGVNDVVNVYSAGFAGAFDGDVGTVLVWVRAKAAVYTGSAVNVLRFSVDGSNFVEILVGATHLLTWRYKAGGTQCERTKSTSSTEWVCLALTWDKTADEVKAYFNGVQEGATMTGLGTWSGTLSTNNTVIGAYGVGAANDWNGDIAHVAVWDCALTDDEVEQLAGV